MSVGTPATPAVLPAPSSRRERFRWLRRGLTALAALAVLQFLVLPQVAGVRTALRLLDGVRPGWLVLGTGLEAASLTSYSMLTRTVFPWPRPAFGRLLRIDLTALGLSHVMPGGGAAASTLRYRLMREGGVPAQEAVVFGVVEAVLSALVLLALLLSSLVLSITVSGPSRLYVVGATAAAVVVLLAGAAFVGLSRGDARAAALTGRVVDLLPARFRPRARRGVVAATGQLAHLLADRRALGRSVGWAAANWLLDAASLWVFLAAFGWHTGVLGLGVAYGLANVAAAIPVSPGGLGVVEGLLIPSLVGFGVPHAEAILGVVSWRLFEFWLPIPVAGLCYLSLTVQGWWDHRHPGWHAAAGQAAVARA